jgi:ElaB/YqjD/DUF883 family membrane-anchored ribosome-binding protein
MEATRKSNHSGAKSNHSGTVAGLAPVVGRVATRAHDAVDRVAGTAAAAAKSIDKKGGKVLRAMQERYVDGARERVRDKPLAALGIAVAAGFVLSLLLNRH